MLARRSIEPLGMSHFLCDARRSTLLRSLHIAERRRSCGVTPNYGDSCGARHRTAKARVALNKFRLYSYCRTRCVEAAGSSPCNSSPPVHLSNGWPLALKQLWRSYRGLALCRVARLPRTRHVRLFPGPGVGGGGDIPGLGGAVPCEVLPLPEEGRSRRPTVPALQHDREKALLFMNHPALVRRRRPSTCGPPFTN